MRYEVVDLVSGDVVWQGDRALAAIMIALQLVDCGHVVAVVAVVNNEEGAASEVVPLH